MILTIPIESERLTLRSLDVSDATERYVSWLKDKTVNQYLETRNATIESLARYIEEKQKSGTALFLGIFVKETGEHIGNVKLEPIEGGRATMGILIGERFWWGKGIATEVTNAVSDYAFRHLGVTEMNLGVIAENAAAIRVYEKCGFVVDRVEKDALNHSGKKFDQVFMVKKVESRK